MTQEAGSPTRAAISREFESAGELVGKVLSDPLLIQRIDEAAQACIDCLRAGNKLLLAGNGGSAADCQHIAAELVGRYLANRPSLPAIALTTDTSALTAIANDFGFEAVFSRQVEALGNEGDILIAYSTSGSSANILQAVETARSQKMVCIGMTGNRQGPLNARCDHVIDIPSDHTPRIQEGHLIAGHTICGLIEQALFNA